MYKWRKTLSFLMALTLLSSSSPAITSAVADGVSTWAIQASAVEVFTDESGFDYVDYGNYVEIIGYEGEETNLEIPAKLDGKRVARIGNNAFATKNTDVTTITVPDSIEYIGANAFAGLVNVKTGYIPTKFIAICAAAQNIEVSKNITELLSFEIQNSTTTKVTIPDGLATIYTEYTIDGSSLANRGVAVPKEVSEADIEGLTAEKLESFVQKYSTIASVTFWNKDTKIPEGAVPVKALVRGYRISTAHTYATDNDRDFEPLDGWEEDDAILNNISFEVKNYETDKHKFHFEVTADTNGYSIKQIGVITDQSNLTTKDTAETDLTLDSSLQGKKIGKKSTGDNTFKTDINDQNNLGAWVRPYVVVYTGAKDESGNQLTVVKYGDVQYVYSEENVKTLLDVQIDPENARLTNKVKAVVTSDNNQYDLVKTGLIIDKTNAPADATEAAELLTLVSDLPGKTVAGKAANNFSGSVSNEGNNLWMVGYVTVSLNGNEITKYTDAQYVTFPDDPFSSVDLTLTDTALSSTKFRFDVNADAPSDVNVLKTGVIMNRTGVLTSENVISSLTLDSDFNAKQMGSADASSYTANASDMGNGIWVVGYAVVEIDGVEEVKYTAPKFVYSAEQIEGVNVSMTASQAKDTDGNIAANKYRFDVVSRTSDHKLVQSGVIVDKLNRFKTAEEAAKSLTLDSDLSNKVVGKKTKDLISNYSANVTTAGKGLWVVGYAIAEDANGNQETYYTEPVYVNSYEDTVKANFSVNMVTTPVEGTIKTRADVTVSADGATIERSGVLVDKTNSVTADTAASLLVLDSSLSLTRGGKAGATSYSANISPSGKGLWIVGYSTIKVGNETITKYTEPVFVENP